MTLYLATAEPDSTSTISWTVKVLAGQITVSSKLSSVKKCVIAKLGVSGNQT